MRWLALIPLIAACAVDDAEIPTTVVHVHLTASCAPQECPFYPEVYYAHCGPSSETRITNDTRSIELTTSYDAGDIAGYVQVQYTSDRVPMGSPELVHIEQALTENSHFDIWPGYYGVGDNPLYRVAASGAVVEIDTTTLASATGSQLQFTYTSNGMTVVENHDIDATRPVRIATDDPGITEACCSAGRAPDLGVVLLALGLAVRARRRRRVTMTR
jgi:hypothetical protein